MVKVLSSVDSSTLPSHITSLIKQRDQAKLAKDYALADSLRAQLESKGYVLNDLPNGGVEVLRIGDQQKPPVKRYLILFGSGEIAPSSVDIYRSTFLTLGKRDLSLALITTPAGFQPNVNAVYEEIKTYLLNSLPDFNLNISLVPINTREDTDNPAYLATIRNSDILFLGPGSPTYALKVLAQTKALQAITEQVQNRATLILASAATISFSRHALPVYEIYKVGENLHWVDGLNLYQELWRETTIIPHFNNREGGVGLDTSYCYMGLSRAKKLLAQLPPTNNIIGIDEHTALIVDLQTKATLVKGKGSVHEVQ